MEFIVPSKVAEEIIEVNLDGDFTGGKLRLSRIGKTVTCYLLNASSSSRSIVNSSAVIPIHLRPIVGVLCSFPHVGINVDSFQRNAALPSGVFQVISYDINGVLSPRTSWGSTPLTWVLD